MTTRAEWLEERRKGIGASDAAAILGLSPYASPLSVFYEKTSGHAIQEDTELMEWGSLLEIPISQKYARVTGREVMKPDDFQIYKMPQDDHLFCTPDRFVKFADPPIGETQLFHVWPLQLKLSAYFNPKEELPLHWQIQEQHEMMVIGSQGASFGILAGARRFYYADVARNDNFIDFLFEKLQEFWSHVQRDIPPKVDDHQATTEALKRMYPKDRGTAIDLPDSALEWRDNLALIQDQQKQLKRRERGIENEIRAAIGDHTYARLPDGTGFSLKTTKRDGFVMPDTTFRQLRTVKAIPKGLLK